MRATATWILTAAFLALAVPATAGTQAELAQEVRRAELAFAKTMADRDHAAFGACIADEAIFFGRLVRRGKAAVLEAWKPLFQGEEAPFSWEPETVEVLDSGTLALSSGPVRDRDGKVIGTFSTIWRREADGRWLVVFDKGCPVCETAPAPAPEPTPKPGK